MLLSVTPPPHRSVASASVLKAKNTVNDSSMIKMEHCRNPLKDSCTSEDIKLYIQMRGQNLPICQQCWNKIAEEEW